MVDITTPYSTVKMLVDELPSWVPELEQERIASYFKYDDIYWSVPESFKIAMADEDSQPIYVPKAKTVVDTTAHYLLKGLQVLAPEGGPEIKKALEDLFARERFYSKFHIAKHAGVARGDFVLHMTADEEKAEGKRISIASVHPAAYFPVYDEWDPDKLLRVHLAEQFDRIEGGQTKTYIRRLTYEYVIVGGTKRVSRTEVMLDERDWFDPKRQKVVRRLLKPELLPPEITVIPVYHFKNIEWDGEDYGRSELSGFEGLLGAINQSVTDEQVALALEGLGVYATDAAGPVDPQTGLEIPWEIAPARVMQVPLGSYFKRVEGIGSVTPILEHINYLQDTLHEASGTSDVARGRVDVAVAESGIALAIKFMPTLAKIEERDLAGVEVLTQFFFDWKSFHAAYEGTVFDDTIEVKIGDKLPEDRTARLNELNNMLDRGVISSKYYRSEMERLGYKFPDDIEEQIAEEQQKKFEYAQQLASLNKTSGEANAEREGEGEDAGAGKSGVAGRPKADDGRTVKANTSNNQKRPNESGATEA